MEKETFDIVALIMLFILGLMVTINLFVAMSDNRVFQNSLQCKTYDGQFTYENNYYVCK